MPDTIFLAERPCVLRQGLRALLEKEPSFSVVGEASDGWRVAELVERAKPDVLILDLVMPGLGGLDVAREVARRPPRTQIIILSMHANEAFVVQALRNGAAAYVLKQRSAAELIGAIREVMRAAVSESASVGQGDRGLCEGAGRRGGRLRDADEPRTQTS